MHQEAAKCEVDAKGFDALADRNAVHPGLLTAGMHDQKVAIGQGQACASVLILPVAQAEIPGCPKR